MFFKLIITTNNLKIELPSESLYKIWYTDNYNLGGIKFTFASEDQKR